MSCAQPNHAINPTANGGRVACRHAARARVGMPRGRKFKERVDNNVSGVTYQSGKDYDEAQAAHTTVGNMNAARVNSSHRGHLWQFRLRTLMLTITACAVLLGWLASHLKHRQQLLEGREIVGHALAQLHCSSSRDEIRERSRVSPHPSGNHLTMIEIDPAGDSKGVWGPYERQLLTRRDLHNSGGSSVDSAVPQSALRRLPGTADSAYYEVVRLRKICCTCHCEFSEGQVIAVVKTRVRCRAPGKLLLRILWGSKLEQ